MIGKNQSIRRILIKYVLGVTSIYHYGDMMTIGRNVMLFKIVTLIVIAIVSVVSFVVTKRAIKEMSGDE